MVTPVFTFPSARLTVSDAVLKVPIGYTATNATLALGAKRAARLDIPARQIRQRANLEQTLAAQPELMDDITAGVRAYSSR